MQTLERRWSRTLVSIVLLAVGLVGALVFLRGAFSV